MGQRQPDQANAKRRSSEFVCRRWRVALVETLRMKPYFKTLVDALERNFVVEFVCRTVGSARGRTDGGRAATSVEAAVVA